MSIPQFFSQHKDTIWSIFKTVMGYGWGILFLFTGMIGGIMAGDWVGLIFVMIGSIIFPPFVTYLSKKNLTLSFGMRSLIVVLLILSIGFSGDTSDTDLSHSSDREVSVEEPVQHTSSSSDGEKNRQEDTSSAHQDQSPQENQNTSSSDSERPQSQTSSSSDSSQESTSEPEPKPEPEPESEPTSDSAGEQYQITEVVDGDTAKIIYQGQETTIRIIGLDTPETVHPQKPVQCFGKEASRKARELLKGKTVTLEQDPTQGNKDNYGRLLRYIILPDGQNFSQVMIGQGYGFEYTYTIPYTYQQQFQQAEAQARANQRGLWSPDTCSGQVEVEEEEAPSPEEPSDSDSSSDAESQESSEEPDSSEPVPNGIVKKTESGICHDPSSQYYARVKNFTSFDTLDACIESGGRVPQ